MNRVGQRTERTENTVITVQMPSPLRRSTAMLAGFQGRIFDHFEELKRLAFIHRSVSDLATVCDSLVIQQTLFMPMQDSMLFSGEFHGADPPD
jgi:hypothetical protein